MTSLDLPPPPVPCKRLWVALSGGLDSTVLLHALRGTPNLRALHVHHGLQLAADDWARRCRRLCRELSVPLRVVKVNVDRQHEGGLEAAAREARYGAFEGVLRDGDVLATAHQREDQAETVLLRALRGTGIAGLAAMRPLRRLGRGRLWRPLLDVPRTEVLRYAKAHGLTWIEDPHNREPHYARSYLRGEIWPLLGRHWPQAATSLARLAGHAAEAQVLLSELAQSDLGLVRSGDGLSVSALLKLSPERRQNVLHHWLPPASADLVDRIEREVLGARADAQPVLKIGGAELRRYRDGLHRVVPLPAAPGGEIAWSRGRTLDLPEGCGRLVASRAPPATLSVRFVQGGEKLKPACGGPTRTLKNLFQERAVPPWVRQRVPLIYEDGALAAVGDWFFSVPFAARGWLPAWERDLPGS